MRRALASTVAVLALAVSSAAPAYATPADPLGLADLDGAALLQPTADTADTADTTEPTTTTAVCSVPTVFAVDAESGRSLSGATYHVQTNDLLTDEEFEAVGPYSGNSTGTWLYNQIEFQSDGDGLVGGEPADEFVITGATPPVGYLPLAEPVTITATVDGWEATGPVVEIAPNVFAIEFQPGEAPDSTGATEENPIVLDNNHAPTFVAVDSATGQPIAGSYWGGETCVVADGGLDWSCSNLDESSYHMDVDGSDLAADLNYTRPLKIRLENRMAPPGCSLVEEPVHWQQDADGVTAYGGGVYQYGETVESVQNGVVHRQTLLAVPFDCSTPAQVCTAADRPFQEVEPGSRFDGAVPDTRFGPSVVRTDAAGRIVSGSVFEVNVYYQREEDGPWVYHAEDFLIDMEADGSFYTRDVSLRQGNYVVEAREVRPAIGTTLRESSYVFVGTFGDDGSQWDGYEGAELEFDPATGELNVNTETVVQDAQQQTLYKINGRDFAIGEPLGSPEECLPAGSSAGSSLWPLILLPPALIGSSIAASSLLPGAPEPAPQPAPAPQAPAQTTVVSEPAPEKAPEQAQAQPAEERQLARTGADAAVLLALAAALIVAGGIVVRLRRV